MKEETKNEIYSYLNKYIFQKQVHSEYLDYYKLYDLNPDMTTMEIQGQIKQKKLRKLFHPDQLAYIDEKYKEYFKEQSEVLMAVENVFSTEPSKCMYDEILEENKKKYEDNSQISRNEFVINQDEKELERALETTIYKEGFYKGYLAIQNAVRGDFSHITEDNKSRLLIEKIGVTGITRIILNNREDITDMNITNCAMDYYCNLINKTGLKEKANLFYNMCLEDALFFGADDNSYHTEFAVSYYLEHGRSNCFIDNNGARTMFDNSDITPEDAAILMWAKMHSLSKNNPKYKFDNFTSEKAYEQVELFASEVKKEARKILSTEKAV